MRFWFIRRSRRVMIAVLVLAVVLVLGIASTVVAVSAYYYQSGGEVSYSYQGWYVGDWAAVSVDTKGLFDLRDSVLAAYAEGWDLGDIGTPEKPVGTGVLTATGGSVIYLQSTSIYSYGSVGFRGAQGVFASDSGTTVNMDSCNILTDEYAGRALLTEKSATVDAEKSTFTTKGPTDAPAVASSFDGGGLITLDDCKVETWGGPSSPAFYSSGGFNVSDTQAFSHESDGAWLDGGGALKWPVDNRFYNLIMYNTALYAYKGNGVSFAKSPFSTVSNDTPAGLAMVASYLEAAGPLFYAPNSNVLISLDHVDTKSYSGVLLSTVYSGSGVGGGQPSSTNKPASRESTVEFNASASTLRGDVITNVNEFSGKDSVVNLALGGWTYFEGAINTAKKGTVNLTLFHEANWKVTADSHVGKLNVPTILTPFSTGPALQMQDPGPDLSMIYSAGHIVFYDPLVNFSLRFITYRLPEGGWLVPEQQSANAAVRPGLR